MNRMGIVDNYKRFQSDIVFQEIQEHLGNPPLVLYDLRPVEFRLCVVGSHEVAEQIARSSKSFPYSMKKSPTMGALEPLLGPYSIITQQVGLNSYSEFV